MILMVERKRGEQLIRRFAGRGNEPDPHDVKIACLKQRIQKLEFPQLQQDSLAEETKTESNVWDDGLEDVNPFGGKNPLLTNETESEPIIWDIEDEKEEYPFVNKHSSFQEEPIVLVEEELCPVYDTDNEEEESMPIYDTDIKYVIEEEEGLGGKEGIGGEEDNIEDFVVVANDICYSMIQTTLSIEFEEDINTKSHELMSIGKSIIIKGLCNKESDSMEGVFCNLKDAEVHGMSPLEISAMKDCIELLSDSVYELKKSIDEMNRPGSKDFRLVMSDIQTWVSSAMTDEDTCSEGFANDKKMKGVVRGKLVNVVHLTSNALALINNYASISSVHG
nr:pectinesterase inhibitor 10-like [Tanacetum cinerariifolium]